MTSFIDEEDINDIEFDEEDEEIIEEEEAEEEEEIEEKEEIEVEEEEEEVEVEEEEEEEEIEVEEEEEEEVEAEAEEEVEMAEDEVEQEDEEEQEEDNEEEEEDPESDAGNDMEEEAMEKEEEKQGEDAMQEDSAVEVPATDLPAPAADSTTPSDQPILPSAGSKRPRSNGSGAASKAARVDYDQASVGRTPIPEEDDDIFDDPSVLSHIAAVEDTANDERNSRLATEAVQCKAGQAEAAIVNIHLLLEILQKSSTQNSVSIAALAEKLEAVSTVLNTAVADTKRMHAELVDHIKSQSGTAAASPTGALMTQEDVDRHLSTLTKGNDDAIRGALDQHFTGLSQKQDEYRAAMMQHVTQTVDEYRAHADESLEELDRRAGERAEGASAMRMQQYEKAKTILESVEKVGEAVSASAQLDSEREDAAIARHSERWKHTVKALNVHTDEVRGEVASVSTALSQDILSTQKSVVSIGTHVAQLSQDINTLAGQMGDAIGAALNAP